MIWKYNNIIIWDLNKIKDLKLIIKELRHLRIINKRH